MKVLPLALCALVIGLLGACGGNTKTSSTPLPTCDQATSAGALADQATLDKGCREADGSVHHYSYLGRRCLVWYDRGDQPDNWALVGQRWHASSSEDDGYRDAYTSCNK